MKHSQIQRAGSFRALSALLLAIILILPCLVTVSAASYTTGTYKPSSWEGLNIRSGASSSYAKVGAIASGTTFTVTRVSGNWGYTTCNNRSGWVCLDYATLISSSNNTPNYSSTSGNTSLESFYKELNKFKNKYPHGSIYVDNSSKTGGYQCFGFANEIGVDIFGSYPTSYMSATYVNSTWTVTYGGHAVDSLCVGDIVRYHYHSIFITQIVGDTIYYCEAQGNNGNLVQWDKSISKGELKQLVSAKLTHSGATTTGWVAHCKNGLSYDASQTQSFYIDANGYVNGEEKKSLNGYVTFDVYVNGSCVKSGVGDFYLQYPNGTTYEIRNIKAANGYDYISGSALSGTINGAHAYPTLTLITKKIEIPKIDSSISSTVEIPGIHYVTEEPTDTVGVPSGYYEQIPSGQSADNYVATTLYRYRDKSENPEYGNWSEVKYSSSAVTESDTVSLVSATKYYNYYHYCRQVYGGYSNNVDSIPYGTGGHYHTKKSTVEMTPSNIPDKGGKILYGGETEFACEMNQRVWAQADPFITYEYAYKIRSKTIKTVYTSWSEWQASVANATNREIENKTFYRYQPKKYTVAYDANGGANAPAAQEKIHGTNVAVSTVAPQRDGYSFMGWALTASSDTVSYNAGAVYASNQNATLYAVWAPNTYTVSYDGNGGSDVPMSQEKVHGKALTLSDHTPSRDGYTFIGWSSAIDGDAEYVSGSSYDADRAITLYALWQQDEIESYYIIYNANGGDNAPITQTKTNGEDIALSAEVPTRNGYRFVGWAIKGSNKVSFQPNDSYTEDKTLYLYAVWEANTYTVTYDANGGTYAPQSQNKLHGEALTLSSAEPHRDGYLFVGWALNSSDIAAMYFAGDVFEENTSAVLYAVWEKVQIEEDNKTENVEFPFTDVPEDAWYRKDVENAHNKGIINGKSEQRYAPTDNITYAECVKLACTIYQLYYNGEVNLTNGSELWYSTYMEYALKNRIIRNDYSSVANEYISRKEFVNIFYGALPLTEFVEINTVVDNALPDVKIGDTHFNEIYTFYRAGILTGNDEKGTFKPNSNIRRNEVAAIVTRMLDSGARRRFEAK